MSLFNMHSQVLDFFAQILQYYLCGRNRCYGAVACSLGPEDKEKLFYEKGMGPPGYVHGF